MIDRALNRRDAERGAEALHAMRCAFAAVMAKEGHKAYEAMAKEYQAILRPETRAKPVDQMLAAVQALGGKVIKKK